MFIPVGFRTLIFTFVYQEIPGKYKKQLDNSLQVPLVVFLAAVDFKYLFRD